MEKVAYKVVRKVSRESVLAEGKYRLIYKKGTVVHTIPGTLGIMVFDYLSLARAFIKHVLGPPLSNFAVVRVKPIGKGTMPLSVSVGVLEEQLSKFYAIHPAPCNPFIPYNTTPPLGTTCYEAVEVLE